MPWFIFYSSNLMLLESFYQTIVKLVTDICFLMRLLRLLLPGNQSGWQGDLYSFFMSKQVILCIWALRWEELTWAEKGWNPAHTIPTLQTGRPFACRGHLVICPKVLKRLVEAPIHSLYSLQKCLLFPSRLGTTKLSVKLYLYIQSDIKQPLAVQSAGDKLCFSI